MAQASTNLGLEQPSQQSFLGEKLAHQIHEFSDSSYRLF